MNSIIAVCYFIAIFYLVQSSQHDPCQPANLFEPWYEVDGLCCPCESCGNRNEKYNGISSCYAYYETRRSPSPKHCRNLCSLRCQPITEVVRGEHNDLIGKSCRELRGETDPEVQTPSLNITIAPEDDHNENAVDSTSTKNSMDITTIVLIILLCAISLGFVLCAMRYYRKKRREKSVGSINDVSLSSIPRNREEVEPSAEEAQHPLNIRKMRQPPPAFPPNLEVELPEENDPPKKLKHPPKSRLPPRAFSRNLGAVPEESGSSQRNNGGPSLANEANNSPIRHGEQHMGNRIGNNATFNHAPVIQTGNSATINIIYNSNPSPDPPAEPSDPFPPRARYPSTADIPVSGFSLRSNDDSIKPQLSRRSRNEKLTCECDRSEPRNQPTRTMRNHYSEGSETAHAGNWSSNENRPCRFDNNLDEASVITDPKSVVGLQTVTEERLTSQQAARFSYRPQSESDLTITHVASSDAYSSVDVDQPSDQRHHPRSEDEPLLRSS